MKCEVSGRKLVEWEIREINGMPLIVCPNFDTCDQGRAASADSSEDPADPAGETLGPDENPGVPTEPPAEREPAPASRRRSRS